MLTASPPCTAARTLPPIVSRVADQQAQLRLSVNSHVVGTTSVVRRSGRILVRLLDVEEPRRPCIVPPLDVPLAEDGEEVRWDPTSQAIDLNGRLHLQLWAGSGRGCVSGSCHEVDSMPIRDHNTVMIPLRWLAEALGWSLDWNGATRTAQITFMAPVPERHTSVPARSVWQAAPWTALIGALFGIVCLIAAAVLCARLPGLAAVSDDAATTVPATPVLLAPALAAAIGIPLLSLSFIKLLDSGTNGTALTDLLKSLIWPLFAVAFALAFAPSIASLVGRIKSGELSGFNMKLVFDTEAREADKNLGAAERVKTPRALRGASAAAGASFGSIRAKVNAMTRPVFATSNILWVDGNPANNANEAAAFRSIGITVEQVETTAAALAVLTPSTHWDVVISNRRRPPDENAGFTLADTLSERGLHMPVVIYMGDPTLLESVKAAAPSHGNIVLVTNDPRELFNGVVNILLNAKVR